MKNVLICFFTGMLGTQVLFAQSNGNEDGPSVRVIEDKEVTLLAPVNKTKLKWTNLGYGEDFFVKIIIPDLANHTLLDHRNLGEDGPCLLTTDTRNLEDIIRGQSENILAPVRIVSRLHRVPGPEACSVYITEDITTKIRGFSFVHQKVEFLPDRHKDDCH